MCPGCNFPYHRGSADRPGTLDTGYFSKCCKPRSRTMTKAEAPSDLSPLTAQDIERIITNAIGTIKPEISAVKIRVESPGSKMYSLSTKMDGALERIGATEQTVDRLCERMTTTEGILHKLQTAKKFHEKQPDPVRITRA